MQPDEASRPAHAPDVDSLDLDPERLADQLRVFGAIDDALSRFERAPSYEAVAIQRDALRRIVLHARNETDFYRERLAPVAADGHFDPRRWHEIPLLTRQHVRDHYDALRARRLPREGWIVEGTTSGSTGTPLRFARDVMASVSTRAVMERLFRWHGFDVEAPLAEIRSFETATAAEPAPRTGWSLRAPFAPHHRLHVTTPIDKQLDWLRSVAPRYLLTYPTLVRELARAALAADGAPPPMIDAVLTVGEVLTPEVRDLAREAFGARVVDTYGCQELGKIAIQCDRSDLYHVCASGILLEVLDEEGRPTRPGAVGRAVITGLYNFAMPLIRYELGDYIRLPIGRCACGRTLPAIAEVLGRKRNMLSLPDGRRIWVPGKVLSGMADFVPMKQYRLMQPAPDSLVLRYVPDGSGRPVDMEGLTAHLRRALHPQMIVQAEAEEHLPRSPGGKYDDVVGLTA